MAQQSAARPSEATMIPPQQANNYGPNAQQQPPYYPTHPGENIYFFFLVRVHSMTNKLISDI